MKQRIHIYLILSIAFAVCTIFISRESKAQLHWKIVGHFNSDLNPYFVNENWGFLYSASRGPGGARASDRIEMYRTSNGGVSWTQLMPMNFGMSGGVTDMCFVSEFHGYAAVSTVTGVGGGGAGLGYGTGGGVYETFDGGDSWKKITAPYVSAMSVYVGPHAVYTVEGEDNGGPSGGGCWCGVGMTTDDGVTWTWRDRPQGAPAPVFGQSIRGNLENSVATAGINSIPEWGTLFTTDGGIKWLKGESEYETWTIYHTR
jgi:hypothetical protein